MRVLAVTWDGGGNVPPMLSIASALQRRGDRVRVLGHRIQRSAIESAGLPFSSIRHGRDWVGATPRSEFAGILGLSGMFGDRGIGADALALLHDEPTDVILVDCLLWGATQELAGAGERVVSLIHSVSAPFDGMVRGPLGLLARRRGTNARTAIEKPVLSLVTTRRAFEASPRPDRVYTGFVWQGRPVEAAPDRPRVLVSFSTVAFPGQAAVLQRTMDALADLDAEVVVTSGAVDPAGLRPPENTRLVQRIDHAELLPSISLVVGHGGHATTARALTAGVPVLVIPMHPFTDQPAIGAAVERLGVGATLPKSASGSAIRAEVDRLLADQSVRDAATRMGADARAEDGASVAVQELDRLVSGAVERAA